MVNDVCRICRARNNTEIRDRLLLIERNIKDAEVTKDTLEAGRGVTFLWDIHVRCRYGFSCLERMQYKNYCKEIARGLEDKLIAVAVGDDEGKYHNVLNLLRGYFPSAHRVLSMVHAKKKTA